jgi:hypothetical protein
MRPRLIADIAIHIGKDKVLRRHIPMLERLANRSSSARVNQQQRRITFAPG